MYNATRTLFLWASLIILGLPACLYGQSTPPYTTFSCGTASLSGEVALRLHEQATQALLAKQQKNGKTAGITYVPIRPHIIRRSDGTGGYTLARMNRVMALTNAHFLQNGSGIQFYFAGASPNYIDSDSAYATGYSVSLFPTANVTNALNQYYVQPMSAAAGIAFFPGNHVTTTHSIIAIQYTDDYLGNKLVPHELGHTFNLHHTHNNIFFGGGTNPTDELVTRGTGANCDTAGDLLCDTPADPYYTGGWSLTYVNGCPVYNPGSSPRDANGDAFSPSISNIMNYYHNPCTRDFTPGQYERMQAGLALRQTHTAYTLDAPPTPVTPPSNLVATVSTNPLIVRLSWQDNATNEMGYFIERSTSSTDGFVPIGGAGADSTSYLDWTVSQNTQYYYRIRPSNTTTGNLSPVVGINLDYCRVAYISGCANNNGLSSVTINGVALSQNSGCSTGGYGQFTATTTRLIVGQPASFSITLLDPSHPHGITVWADLNHNFSLDLGEDLYLSNGPVTGTITGSITIPAGTNSGPLLVRVLSAYNTMPFFPCSVQNGNQVPYEAGETEDYTLTVQQTPVTGLSSTSITGSTARLTWNSLGPGVTYDVQVRQQGITPWTSYSNWFTPPLQLLYLSMVTTYEWQVRESGTLTYSGPVSFTTLCEVPSISFTNLTRTTATLYWNTPSAPASGYTLRYRLAGTPDWTTIAPASSGYSLTGLSSNTPYEWQVMSNCSAALSSAFTPIQSFTTQSCQAPYLTGAINLISNAVSLYWTTFLESGATYRLQYRSVGAASWQTVESLTSTTYSLTGLTPNTPYQWQVQTVCTPSENSTFTPGASFTTICPVPLYKTATPVSAGANLTWQINPAEGNKTFDVQYRQQGNPNWTTVSGLTVTSFSSYRTYVLTGLANNTAYEWRVRTNCQAGTQSDFTDVSSFTTTCAGVYAAYTSLVSASSANLIWSSPYDPAASYELRWRPTGTPTWTTVSNLTTNFLQGAYLLTGLTNNTPYEWQVRTICSTTEAPFTNGENFTTSCPVPATNFVTATVSSVVLTWSAVLPNIAYEVNYRPVGAAIWTVVSNVTATSLAVSGLMSSTTYEWQIRTQCGEGIYSAFSATRTFATSACSIPQFLSAQASDKSATLIWNFYSSSPDTRFEIRWRAVGVPIWTTVSSLTVISGAGRYSLTGLTPSTNYEWQVRTICSATESSTFTASQNFQTIPLCPVMYTLKIGSWDDPKVWSCNRVPISNDAVQVRHVVFVFGNYTANALKVQFEGGGKISYTGNGRLRLGL